MSIRVYRLLLEMAELFGSGESIGESTTIDELNQPLGSMIWRIR